MNHMIFMTHLIYFLSKSDFYRKTNFYFALQKFYSTIQMPFSDWSVEILRNYNVSLYPNLTVFFLSHDICKSRDNALLSSSIPQFLLKLTDDSYK